MTYIGVQSLYMTTMTATEARARLPEILDRVSRGEEVTITRHETPVAVVVAPNALRHRRAAAEAAIARAEQFRRDLDQRRREPLASAGALRSERADELVRQLRTERDAG